MKKQTFFAVTSSLTALALASMTATTTTFAHGMMAPHASVMAASVVDQTHVQLDAKELHDLQGTTITLTAPMEGRLTGKYDKMSGSFALTMGEKLMPGVRYTVHAVWKSMTMKPIHVSIPNLTRVRLVAANEIELIYNEPVDGKSATNPQNYWIQNNETMAANIANLGKSDKVTPTNGLTAAAVTIKPEMGSNRKFFMTFTAMAKPGTHYHVIPCYVSAIGEGAYKGPNSTMSSKTMFTAMKFS